MNYPERNTADQIRRDSHVMVEAFKAFGKPAAITDRDRWLLEQSKVVALQEIAAQLAELNEREQKMAAQEFIVSEGLGAIDLTRGDR